MSTVSESTSPRDAGRDLVGSLERGLGVLEVLAAHPAGLTLTEMAERAGLTRAGARRLLLTLVAAGHARQEGRRFLMTARVLSLARTWLQGVSLWDYAYPFLREVSAAINESCSAAVLAGSDVVYVARVPGPRIMSVALNVGTRLPAYCTSMGRVLLSDLPSPDLDDLLRRSDIRANTKKTVMNRVEIARAIRQAADDGFAVVDEELEIGLRSIAVPVRDRTGRIVAAINVPAQSSRYTVQELEARALPHLRKAAAAIENYFVVQ
ncbi:MAG: helix-turn-helix domain-containing protein [Rhizobiaceae bacterium]|nr:helix-turn-helix domain-containing protein [Rhizobiaceae bacterium]